MKLLSSFYCCSFTLGLLRPRHSLTPSGSDQAKSWEHTHTHTHLFCTSAPLHNSVSLDYLQRRSTEDENSEDEDGKECCCKATDHQRFFKSPPPHLFSTCRRPSTSRVAKPYPSSVASLEKLSRQCYSIITFSLVPFCVFLLASHHHRTTATPRS